MMKYVFIFIICVTAQQLSAQSLELSYDARHTLNPAQNAKNYPSLFFEYFKGKDSGSVLVKMQADMAGDKNNISKAYVQVSRSMRFWKPRLFLQLEYSGGLGLTEPKQYSYYITNAFSVGVGHPFQWKGAFYNAYTCYTYSPYKKPSHDALFSFYWWKGLLNYKLVLCGDFSIWTRNKNQGDDLTAGLHGKRTSLFAEPQVWYTLFKVLSVGTRINCYYHVITTNNDFQVYPAIGLKYKL